MHLFDCMHQGSRTYLKGIYTKLILIAEDLHLYFIAHDVENLKKEFGEPKNVTFIKLKTKNKFYRLLFEIPKIIRKHKIDYSHFQYIIPPIKINKYIVTTHDILFHQEEFKSYFPLKYRIINGILFRISAKRADILLTVSEYSKKQISKKYNIPIDKIYVTPNAVEEGFEKTTGDIHNEILKNQKIILYVSRVEPRKNHLALIQAYLDLKLYQQNYKLVFIGAFDFPSKELLSYLEKNKQLLNNNVIWEQNIAFEEVKSYYKNCEVFVFPSLAEGFGIPVIEAMKFYKKVLVSDSTAMKDFNLPKELTFKPYDLEDLKMKLRALLLNSNDYTSEYDKILSHYSWKKSAEVVLKRIKLDYEK